MVLLRIIKKRNQIRERNLVNKRILSFFMVWLVESYYYVCYNYFGGK